MSTRKVHGIVAPTFAFEPPSAGVTRINRHISTHMLWYICSGLKAIET